MIPHPAGKRRKGKRQGVCRSGRGFSPCPTSRRRQSWRYGRKPLALSAAESLAGNKVLWICRRMSSYTLVLAGSWRARACLRRRENKGGKRSAQRGYAATRTAIKAVFAHIDEQKGLVKAACEPALSLRDMAGRSKAMRKDMAGGAVIWLSCAARAAGNGIRW